MKNTTVSPIKPIKKTVKTITCANCGVSKGSELICPVCHSIGGLYLFEWIILLVSVLVIVLLALIVVVLVTHR